MKSFFALASIALTVLFHIGCSSDIEQAQFDNPATINGSEWISAAPLHDDVVLENMYEDETHKLTDKSRVQIVTVLEGTGRVTLEARFRGVRDFGFGFPLYECELIDEAAEAMGGIAKGMSGSPVGPPGRVMGALAYGDDFSKSPTRFWVTAIDAMETAIERQTFGDLLDAELAPAAPSSGISSVYSPVKTPLMISGIQPNRIQQLAEHLNGPRFEFLELFSDVNGAPDAPPVKTTRIAAGDMIGVAIAIGDVVNAIGFGTVTQVYDDDTFVAFGHPMNGDGKAALPVYRAVVNGIVPNLQASYKSASAYGNPIGTITKDLIPAIVGKLGVLPEMIPVKVAYQIGSDTVIEKYHRVAYGQEIFIPVIAALTMDSLRQEISPGTVDATVTLHFKETETAYTESFRITSPVVFFDTLINVGRIITSFTDIFANNAGKATLSDVSITIKDRPQIMLASIHELKVPDELIPGESAIFTVVLLPHWSAVSGGRKIEKEITLEIPENFPVGIGILNVTAENSFGPPGSFGDIFNFDFDGQEGEEKLPPENLDELIKQMEENQIQLGLVTITLTSEGSGFGFPIFDDFLVLEDSEIPEGAEVDTEMPEDPPLPDDFIFPDELPLSEDIQPSPPIETEIIIEGFVVTGSKEISVTIKGDERPQ